MRIAEFLRQRIYPAPPPPSLNTLDAFAGRRIPHTRFEETIQQARARCTSATPLFCVPIGEHAGFHIGVHLRPNDVATRRVALLQIQDASTMVEVAGAPEHLLFLSLARREGELQKRTDEEFTRAVDAVQSVVGQGFYRPGAYGDFTDDEAQDIMAAALEPSAHYFLSASVFEQEPSRQLELLERGITKEPGCMGLFIYAAQLHLQRGEQPQAAARCAQSLECYHHTSYGEDLEAYYETARSLLEQFPGEFDDDDRRDLDTYGDDKARLLWVTELYSAGRVELATKVLCDICHALQDYESVLHIFRKHFEKLGWSWGLALCELRQS